MFFRAKAATNWSEERTIGAFRDLGDADKNVRATLIFAIQGDTQGLTTQDAS